MSGVWTCPRNHRWRPAATDSVTLDAVQPCPVCGESGTFVNVDPGKSFDVAATLLSGAPRPVAPVDLQLAGYTIAGEVGRGAMGVVYRATEDALNRPVALKMILAGAHAGTHDLARFQREVQTVATLRHPNIVQIYAVGETGGLPYCALEFVEGGTLADRLRSGPLDPPAAARLVADLARAVHYAHQKGIVHRDLKPANVLIDADGRPKIADFGLAKFGDNSSLTGSAAVLGTPAYMAPEQADGRGKTVGPAADIYSLGAMLYECLTGRPPFKAGSALETLQQVLHDDPTGVRRSRPDVPRDLETVALKCLEKDPARRYPSAEALADDLDRFLAGHPVTARPLSWGGRTVRRASRYRAALTGAAIATAVTLLLVGLFWREPAGEPGHAGAGGESTTGGGQQAEEAELLVRVGDKTGPGSLYFERGVVLTSTDLLGMAGKDSPPPPKVEVVYHPGRSDERTYDAEVVSVEPTVKVGVLRLRGDRLPDPPQPPSVTVAASPPQPAEANPPAAPAGGEAPSGRATVRMAPAPAPKRVGLDSAVEAAIQVRVTRAGRTVSGPGFFVGPPGVVVAGTPLVAARENTPPDSLQVAVGAGTPAERLLPARLLALDRDAGLAVLQVEGQDLPDPVPFAPANWSKDGTKLFTIAAAGPGQPAAPEPAMLTGRLATRSGGVRYYQVEAARSSPGVSVVDGLGRLVGVGHAGLGGTRIHFLTPAEFVERLLDGRLLTVTPGQPVATDGAATMPVRARLADPLGRVRGVALSVWAEDVGPIRPATGAKKPDDPPSARAVELRLAQESDPVEGRLAEGDIPLPTLTGRNVVWVRPRYTGADGGTRWGEAVPLGVPPPAVRPVPADPRFRPGDGRVTLQFHVPMRSDGQPVGAPEFTAALAEEARTSEGGTVNDRLTFQDVRSAERAVNSLIHSRGNEFLTILRRQTLVLKESDHGTAREGRVETTGDVKRDDVLLMDEEAVRALEVLAVPLPNREVPAGETWDGELRLGGSTRPKTETVWTVTYRYVGRRSRGGRDEAVIELTGRPTDVAAHGTAAGAAVVDLASGRVVLAHARFDTGGLVPFRAALARSITADGPAPDIDMSALPPDQPVHIMPHVR
jgi:hypothetical protein